MSEIIFATLGLLGIIGGLCYLWEKMFMRKPPPFESYSAYRLRMIEEGRLKETFKP